jgi:hypothetical protein
MDALVAFSFPPTTDGLVNAQFQAIAGLHGLSKQAHLREAILIEGGLEPLILGARGNNRHADIEIQREATATISNLALAEANRLVIAKSGALPALVNITKMPKIDAMCTVHAVTALANLAETSHEIHELLLSEQCVGPMCELVQDDSSHIDIKRSISRCFALFACNEKTHNSGLLATAVTSSIRTLVNKTGDNVCERFGALAVGNLALIDANHGVLIDTKLMESIVQLANAQDIETLRGTAFALHLFSKKDSNHSALEAAGAIECLVPLLQCGDRETLLQASLAIKYLSTLTKCRIKFVDCHGHESLLANATSDDLETKRELAAALRNLTLSDENKAPIMQAGLDFIATLCRDSDKEVSHQVSMKIFTFVTSIKVMAPISSLCLSLSDYQACGIIANISEKQENKVPMVERGIIHHLHTAMLLDCTFILRESVRAFANLSSAIDNTSDIVNSGALSPLITALNSNDILSRRFAAMTLSNLAINTEIHARIIHEVGTPLLMIIARQGDRNLIDMKTQQNGMACLANLASCSSTHTDLLHHGCAELAMNHVKSSDLDLRTNALLCIANLSSNKANHSVLEQCCKINELIENLECHDGIVQLHAITSLRGLSTDISLRKQIITAGGTEVLLSLVRSEDESLKLELFATYLLVDAWATEQMPFCRRSICQVSLHSCATTTPRPTECLVPWQ